MYVLVLQENVLGKMYKQKKIYSSFQQNLICATQNSWNS